MVMRCALSAELWEPKLSAHTSSRVEKITNRAKNVNDGVFEASYWRNWPQDGPKMRIRSGTRALRTQCESNAMLLEPSWATLGALTTVPEGRSPYRKAQ